MKSGMDEIYALLEAEGFIFQTRPNGRIFYTDESGQLELDFISNRETGNLELKTESAFDLLEAYGFEREGIRFNRVIFCQEPTNTIFSIQAGQETLSQKMTRHLFDLVF